MFKSCISPQTGGAIFQTTEPLSETKPGFVGDFVGWFERKGVWRAAVIHQFPLQKAPNSTKNLQAGVAKVFAAYCQPFFRCPGYGPRIWEFAFKRRLVGQKPAPAKATRPAPRRRVFESMPLARRHVRAGRAGEHHRGAAVALALVAGDGVELAGIGDDAVLFLYREVLHLDRMIESFTNQLATNTNSCKIRPRWNVTD